MKLLAPLGENPRKMTNLANYYRGPRTGWVSSRRCRERELVESNRKQEVERRHHITEFDLTNDGRVSEKPCYTRRNEKADSQDSTDATPTRSQKAGSARRSLVRSALPDGAWQRVVFFPAQKGATVPAD